MLTQMCPLLALLAAAPAGMDAQQIPTVPAAARPSSGEDVAAVAQGWLLLSQGSAPQAAARAKEVLRVFPTSPGALALAVEAAIAGGGATAGLRQYEDWLGRRTMEEPLLLRRIARAVLVEAIDPRSDPRARIEALRALASDGDARAVEALRTGASGGNTAALRVLAESGDPAAARTLIDQMAAGTAEPIAALEALSKGGSPAAARAALARLKDQRPEIRAAAADALGRVKGPDAGPALRALLSDQSPFVRFRAAAALLELGDDTGLPLVQEMAGSDMASTRLIAAGALAVRPDEAWLTLVRTLARASEPEVRLGAAKLLIPHDPELARTVVNGLRDDPNPAIRAMVSEVAAETAGGDLARLRALLHRDPLERVRAAATLLSLTR
jgi:HEAT repeat protein